VQDHTVLIQWQNGFDPALVEATQLTVFRRPRGENRISRWAESESAQPRFAFSRSQVEGSWAGSTIVPAIKSWLNFNTFFHRANYEKDNPVLIGLACFIHCGNENDQLTSSCTLDDLTAVEPSLLADGLSQIAVTAMVLDSSGLPAAMKKVFSARHAALITKSSLSGNDGRATAYLTMWPARPI
jgi:hypothetical protein